MGARKVLRAAPSKRLLTVTDSFLPQWALEEDEGFQAGVKGSTVLRRSTPEFAAVVGEGQAMCTVGIPKRPSHSFQRRVFKSRDSNDGLEQVTCDVSIGFKKCVCVNPILLVYLTYV